MITVSPSPPRAFPYPPRAAQQAPAPASQGCKIPYASYPHIVEAVVALKLIVDSHVACLSAVSETDN